jgi:hypothetical protein
MRDAVWSEGSHARDILEAQTGAEVSYVADDPDTGLRCKVRPDAVVDGAGIIVDLKTTKNAGMQSFSRDLYTLGYFMSAPFYMNVMNWLDGADTWRHHVFLVMEKDPPYAFRTLSLDPASMDVGTRAFRRLLARYAECLEADEWPGYYPGTEPIGIPGWAFYIEGERG